MTVSKGKWAVYKDSSAKDMCYIDRLHTGHDKVYGEIGCLFHTDDAQMVVKAINQCQAINPDHPELVARQIEEMHKALREATTRIHNHIRYETEGEYRELLQKTLRECESVLAKIEGEG